MVNNIIFVGIAFAVFWGTVYPIISEAATGQRITVGPPYFNIVIGPILLGMLLLMGIAPLLPWRRASRTHLYRHLMVPVISGLLALPLLALVGIREWAVFVALALVVFVAVGHGMEFYRGWRAQRLRGKKGPLGSLLTLIERNRRRYGGYIIHIGVIVMALGIVISSFYRQEMDITVEEGEEFTFEGYTMQFTGLELGKDETKEHFGAPLIVRNSNGLEIANIAPALDYYFKIPGGQRETEPAVKSFLSEDLYVVMTGFDISDKIVTYKIFIEPLIGFVWLGGLILIFGSFIVIWPDPREARILARIHAREVVTA
jgi:cytochrome c-type biogenesis protein CcmF